MSDTSAAPPAARPRIDTTSERRLPWYHLALTGLAAAVLAAVLLLVLGKLSIAGVVVLGYFLHLAIAFVYSRLREGRRWATDRFVSLLVFGAFGLALIPLVSLLMEVVVRGAPRLVAPAS